MNTQLVIENHTISVNSDGMYCLNDLHKAAMALGKATESQKPSNFIKSQADFIKIAENATGVALKQTKGRNGGTWAVELIAMKYAGWIDASFEVKVYSVAHATFHGNIEKAVELSGSKAAKAALDDMRFAKAAAMRAQATDQQLKNALAIYDLLPHLSNESKQAIASALINATVGAEIIPLPVITEHYYTAGEVGERYGISANKVGRLANEHNLKNEKYGKFFLDKSRSSTKQVETFRYNDAGMKAIGEIITLIEVGGAA